MSDYSVYPNTIDGYAQLPVAVDGVTEINAFSVNTLRSAIYNIEVELGVLPSGDSATVATRLDVVQDAIDTVEAAVNALEEEVNNIGNLPPIAHATTHESGGSDEIIGDNLSVEYDPTNYSTDNEVLSDHLEGIDSEFATTIAAIVGNKEEMEEAAGKFLKKLDMIIFHLELITGASLPESDTPMGKLDDIIFLFALMTEG